MKYETEVQPPGKPVDPCWLADQGKETGSEHPRAANEPHGADVESLLHVSDILEALPFYVMLVDEEHQILAANGPVRAQLGAEPEAIRGKYCPEVIHGLDGPWYACPLEEAAVKGQPVEREALDQKTGRWISSAMYPTGRLTSDGRRIFFHMVSDITDRKEVEEQLKASREQLRELSLYLESVREEERANIARTVHDELGQILTALKLDLSWLTKRLAKEHGLLVERTMSMRELLDTAIQTVERVSAELRPGMLDDLGLAAAIEWQTQELQKRTKIRIRFTSSRKDMVLDRDRSTTIFRICQEALTNVVRHANATEVDVSLTKKAGRIVLRVCDNGKGIDEKRISDPKAFGLIGMRERVRPWGGDMSISGIPGKGTLVVVSIPLAHKEHLDAESAGGR